MFYDDFDFRERVYFKVNVTDNKSKLFFLCLQTRLKIEENEVKTTKDETKLRRVLEQPQTKSKTRKML